MAETILKGRVENIGPITQVGEKNTDLQYMILFIPGYHDGFEKKGRDQMWALQALGKKVAELKMNNDDLLGKIVTVKCYLDSQLVPSKEAGKDPFYSVNATIHSFEITK